VANFIVILSAGLFFLLSPTAQNIERAFLQNNSKILYSILSSRSSINISLPEPISFSNQVSNQQAYFLFQRIFSSYTTLEFYSETELSLLPDRQDFIFKARWSFENNKNKNQHVIHVFFFLMKEESGQNRNAGEGWRILEIKAAKI
jgi:hypothetical protein